MNRNGYIGAILMLLLSAGATRAQEGAAPGSPAAFRAAHAAIDSLGRVDTDAALRVVRAALAHAQQAEAAAGWRASPFRRAT